MELDLALKKAGQESYVFCTNRDEPQNGIYCMGTPLSRNIHGLLSRLTGLQGYYSRTATRKMLKKLDEIKPDVVHLGNLHGNYIHVNMLLDYLVEKQIPTVITLHDCWLFTGHCCHYLEDNCDRWQYGCGKCPAKHKWNKSWFFDRSAKVYTDTREEMLRATDMGAYYRISPDARGLNYDKFYVEGTVNTEGDDAYTSHNTNRLDVDGVVKKLMSSYRIFPNA